MEMMGFAGSTHPTSFFATTALEMPGWLGVVAAFQTLSGAALLFLSAVALRNRFRMR
jgi:hypothetical protein